MYLEDHVFQKDVAKYFKVSPQLVSQLVKEAKGDREQTRELRKQEEKKEEKNAITRVVNDMLDTKTPIMNAEMVAQQVKKKEHMEVDVRQVRSIMKETWA